MEKVVVKEDCANLPDCLNYHAMTLDPQSEVLSCGTCPAYAPEKAKD